MAKFDLAIMKIATNEGGYVNDAADRGGETKYGISKKSYPGVDIANLTWPQAKEIYQRDFWNRLRLDSFEDQLIAEQVFDHGVNAGVGRAARLLQDAFNLASKKTAVAADGIIGPKTIAAVNGLNKPDDLLAIIKGLRFVHYHNLVRYDLSQEKFFLGWVHRIEI